MDVSSNTGIIIHFFVDCEKILPSFRQTYDAVLSCTSGEVLKDEIEYRGISQKKLAAEMGVPYTLLNEVLNAKRPVNTEFALLIEAVLDLPAEPLLKMQARYNMLVTKRNSKFIEKLNQVRKIAAVF